MPPHMRITYMDYPYRSCHIIQLLKERRKRTVLIFYHIIQRMSKTRRK